MMGKRICWICLLLLPTLGWAQGLPVRYARFNVYEKELSGFEVLLPADSRSVRDGIAGHLRPYTNAVIVFEDMVICEDIHYAPVSVWQPLTLVYQIEAESPRLTRLRVAALADFRYPVTVDQVPDLALRLLLDLDQMAGEISGQQLDFDALFVDITNRDLVEKYRERKAAHAWSIAVERRPEEVVEQTGLLLRQEDLMPPEALTAIDDSIISIIGARFRDYVSRNSGSTFLSEEEHDQTILYRDSMARLSEALNEVRLINEALLQERDSFLYAYEGLRQDVGDLPEEIQMRLAALEVENQSLRASLQQNPPDLKSGMDSLSTHIGALDRRMDSITELNRQLRMQLREKEQELGVVFARLERLEQEAVPVQEPDQAATEREQQLEQLQATWAEEQRSLTQQVDSFRMLNDSLQRVLTALNPESERAIAQRAVYLRRIRQLDQAQDALVQRLWAVSNREKLVRQREQFLARYEREGEEAELLLEISRLEEEIRKTYEEVERNLGQATLARVEPAFLRIEGEEIPAFVVKTKLPPSWSREQLASWARLHEIQILGADILSFTSSQLPAMEGRRYHFEMTMLDRGQGSVIYVTVRAQDGAFLDAEDGSLESRLAIRLLEDIFG